MLSDGVYLNLPENLYFAEMRLGSTDLSRLYLNKEGWWWKSHLNPDRVEEAEEAKNFGKALHALILEGESAFEARFAIAPDKDEERRKHGDRFCVTKTEIMTQLEVRGFNPKASEKVDFLIEYAKTRAPDLVIWQALVKSWEAANVGKTPVSTVEERQLRVMAAAVRDHPEIGVLFHYDEGNVPLPEVTVLWHDEHGIPRRGRIDQLLPNTTIDVKTLQNTSGRPLAFAVGEHAIKLGYHVQMADHHIARKIAYRFIREGKIFNGADFMPDLTAIERTKAQERFDRELAWIKRFPEEAPSWDYAWLFYQKPDARAGLAPIVFPWAEDYGGELHMAGIRCRREAIETYRRCMKQFGPDVPWTRVEPLHTSLEGARVKHRVFLPSWIGGQEPVAGEEEDL